MKAYLDIVEKVLTTGTKKKDRTGTGTIAIAGAMFECDLADGYPLLTTKQMPFRAVATELEFFIRGITSKQWLLDRKNHIWDEWCSPDKVPYSHDPEEQRRMMEEIELGPIYGWQWRNFGAEYVAHDKPAQGQGIDQLKKIVESLKTDPSDRRMLVMAWNPMDLHRMALPPCHYGFQVTVLDGRLNLLWNQRSVDVALGLPFNIASYSLLLHLLAKETGLQEGKLVGFLADTHIYINHIEGLKGQLERDPLPLSSIRTDDFTSIFEWQNQQSKVADYQHHPRISFDIAV
jgi:thymidylate synthase